MLDQPRVEMAKLSVFTLIFFAALIVNSAANDRCSTLSCVHASATIIQKLNTEVDPCDDFYDYACGTFLEEQHTPDEKSTVDTIALMGDKLTEYLLTLLLKPAESGDTKLHKLAKSLFKSCLDDSKTFDGILSLVLKKRLSTRKN